MIEREDWHKISHMKHKWMFPQSDFYLVRTSHYFHHLFARVYQYAFAYATDMICISFHYALTMFRPPHIEHEQKGKYSPNKDH